MGPQDNPALGSDRVAEALGSFHVRWYRRIDRIMTAGGASFARARVLAYIARKGPLRLVDLASTFGHAPRTVTEAIDGLERDGLVRRDPDPDDRRAKRVSLTAAGERAALQAEASRVNHVEELFGVLDLPERAELLRLIGRLSDRLEALGG